MDRCSHRGCLLSSEDVHGFCTAHMDEIFQAAARQVDDTLEVASKIYFGRSAFPERRLVEHVSNGTERDHLLILHWAANWAEIEELEEALIDSFTKQFKIKRVENESDKSDGAFSGAWNALYVSFCLKNAFSCIPGATVIESLHRRNRLWPNPVIPNAPVLLRCEFTQEEAKAELDRFSLASTSSRSRGVQRKASPYKSRRQE
jgi:hypothetical protein